MIKSTLCYLIRDGKWLMLFRDRKQNDINRGKWIGIGGKVEEGEAPREAIYREITEETGFKALSLVYCGIVYFTYDYQEDEKIWVYTSTDFTGEQCACDEGTLKWIDADELMNLTLWDGDRYFLNIILTGRTPFCIELNYDIDGHLLRIKEKRIEAE